MQRVRVGMTGLAAVLILIGISSAILSSTNREAPVEAIGAPREEVVANVAGVVPADPATAKAKEEPLAELGVAPRTEPANASTASPPQPPAARPAP